MGNKMIDTIDEMSSFIKNNSKWKTSKKPFGQIKKGNESYIYEFYCYVNFVNELKINNNIIFIEGALKGIFPRGPAFKKNGWAKFQIIDNNKAIYDICAGVNIEHSTIEKYTFGADISIQNCEDEPKENDLYMIIDAKYKSNEKSSLSISTLREFRAVLGDFGLIGNNLPNGINSSGVTFDCNSLVTNGKPYTNEEYEKKYQFKVVDGYK